MDLWLNPIQFWKCASGRRVNAFALEMIKLKQLELEPVWQQQRPDVRKACRHSFKAMSRRACKSSEISWIGILAIPVCSVVAALKNSNQRKVLKLIDADSKTMSSADLKVVPLAPIWGSYGFLISARVLVLSFLGRLLQSLVERVVAHEQKVQDLKAQKLSQHAVWPSYQSYQSNIIKPSYHSEIVENTWNICRKWPAASNVNKSHWIKRQTL